MGKSLYRSYRSTSFDEIIGQDHIVTTLKNALVKGQISHAYILSGPRGVGKTSVARILAYAVNEQPYSLEATNLDIIEIDAASNRRIDEIREIKERVHTAPVAGKYKVYIIDEVHMLTREAFNALLKTLEEPPEHAIFILATTEIHKVPETITSRCINFSFRPIESEVLTSHLKTIAKKEKLSVSEDALALLAEHARGSFRDAISLLEQVKHHGEKIEQQHVASMLGMAPRATIDALLRAVANSDLSLINQLLSEAYQKGTPVGMLTSQLQSSLRDELLNNDSLLPRRAIISCQQALLNVNGSPKPRIALELVLHDTALKVSNSSAIHTPVIKPLPPAPVETTINSSKSNVTTSKKRIPKTDSLNEETKPTLDKIKTPQDTGNTDSLWTSFLELLKQRNNTLYGIARMAKVSQEGDNIHLEFAYSFHQKQVNDSKNLSIFTKLLSDINGSPISLSSSVVQKKPPSKKFTEVDPLVSVSNIFGGHEVLES